MPANIDIGKSGKHILQQHQKTVPFDMLASLSACSKNVTQLIFFTLVKKPDQLSFCSFVYIAELWMAKTVVNQQTRTVFQQ